MPTLSHPVGTRAQRGFTLIEIAIVLVIIGLLMGGILKGQELIENARVKETANLFNSVAVAHYGYIDRYKRLPGDDGDLNALRDRGGNWTRVTEAGNMNGSLAALSFSNAGEQPAYWQHLRAAGLITGDPSITGIAALPRNAWGGLVGVFNADTQGRSAVKLALCLGSVPGKAAAQLDTMLDDGISGQGALRATLGSSNIGPWGAAASSYSEDQTYTICKEF